jgi:hypothetical protein
VPGGGEGVCGVGGEVLFDGELEAVLADVAPGADGVGDDGDVVFGHGAGCCAERHGGWFGGLLCGLLGLVLCVGMVCRWGCSGVRGRELVVVRWAVVDEDEEKKKKGSSCILNCMWRASLCFMICHRLDGIKVAVLV